MKRTPRGPTRRSWSDVIGGAVLLLERTASRGLKARQCSSFDTLKELLPVLLLFLSKPPESGPLTSLAPMYTSSKVSPGLQAFVIPQPQAWLKHVHIDWL